MFNFDNIMHFPAVISIVFLIAGLIMYIFPPKKINYLYGYRTNSSMKSEQRWNFAQKYSSIQMMFTAIKLFIISLMLPWFNLNFETNTFLQIAIIVVALGFMFYKIEKAIKVNFPND
jgi:uncharacterized membrane protein